MAFADAAWVDVLPSMRSFGPTLDRQLGSLMPQAGRTAGMQFGQAFSSTAAQQAEQASAKMSAALRKVEEAAGKVRIAEANLNDVRAKGTASQTQLTTAEERLATARRNQTGANEKLNTATQQVATTQRAAAEQMRSGTAEGEAHVGMLGRMRGSLSLMRDAAVAAWGAWMGLSVVTRFLGDAVEGAAHLNEMVNRTKIVFGDSAQGMLDWAKTTTEGIGLSEQAALEASGRFGNLFRTIGLGQKPAADMSEKLVEVAADLASFHAVDPSDVLKAMQSGMVGAARPMRQFGVDLSVTTMKAEALKMGMDVGPTLTMAQKAQVAYQLILEQTTLAQGDYARTSDGLINSQKRARAEWSDAKDALGQLIYGPVTDGIHVLNQDFIPAFMGVVTIVGDAISWFGRLPGPIKLGAEALGLWLLLSGPMRGFFVAIATGVGNMVASLAGSVYTMGALRGAATGMMSMFGGAWGLAITGISVALGFLVQWLNRSKGATKDNTESQQQMAEALKASKGAIDDNVRASAAKVAQDRGLLDAAKNAGVSLYDMTSAILGQGDAYGSVMASLVRYRDANTGMDGQRTAEAVQVNNAIVLLASLAGATDVNVQKAKDLAAATDGKAASDDNAARAAEQHDQELEGMKQAASDAKTEVDNLKLALDMLTQGHISVAEAEAAFYDATSKSSGAMKDLTGALVQNGGTIDVTSEKGRKAQDVLFGIRDADDMLIASYEHQGMTADQVQAKDAALRESFIKSAMQMGFSRQAAEELANQILGIPAERNTRIAADTSQATQAAAELQRQIDALHGRTVTIEAEVAAGHYGGASNWIMMPRAEGGPIPGWSPTPRADNIHVAATAGEFMQPVPSVQHYGLGFMEAVRTRRFPRELAVGLANGGSVPPVSIQAELNDAVYTSQMDAAISQLGRTLEPAMGYVAALNFARAQVGKPYIWGAVGPGGYDCSGFMSAITNVIRGVNPYQRVGSTASFPWPGFRYGYGPFTIGNTPDAGGGIGHMAGTLLGINVESTDGSVRIGSAARGADDSLFWNRATLADSGGLWPPGVGLNLTGDIERVLKPEQDDYFRRFVDLTERAGGMATSVSGISNSTINVTNLDELAAVQRRETRNTLTQLGLRRP